MANFWLAFEQDLAIVPVLNKIDAPGAEPERVAEQLASAFDLDPAAALSVSAKTGLNLGSVLPAVIERVPPPPADPGAPLRALLFDAYHDPYRGVVCLLAIKDGVLRAGDRVTSAGTGSGWVVGELGVLAPEPRPTGVLRAGQVGYVLAGMKDTRQARVGDTWHAEGAPVPALPGFKPARSMVYAGVYPLSADGHERLASALEKLCLTDASVAVARENSAALGAGFRCGFLGLLHLDVFRQRLEQEHGAAVLVTAPTVPCEVLLQGGRSVALRNPADFPTDARVEAVMEPTVRATIVTPEEHTGAIMQRCQAARGELLDHAVLGPGRTLLK